MRNLLLREPVPSLLLKFNLKLQRLRLKRRLRSLLLVFNPQYNQVPKARAKKEKARANRRIRMRLVVIQRAR